MLLIALFCLSLMTDSEICVAVFVNPVLRSLPETEQIPFLSRAATNLGFAMPFWYVASFALTVAWLLAEHRASGHWQTTTLVSAGVQVAIVAMTVTLMVPINNRLGKLRPGDVGWTPAAKRWDRLHQLRVVLLIVAVVALAI